MAASPAKLEASALFRVDGMIAVITGGGTGIGLVMARALAANGAQRVYILGRRLAVLEEAAAASTPAGVLVPVQCDVASKDSLQAAVDRIAAETGHVNLVVANAGLGGPGGRHKWGPDSKSVAEARRDLFTDLSMDEFNATLQVNVAGAFFTMTAFLELLDAGNKNALKGGFGRPDAEGSPVPAIQSQVVVTSSISAFSRSHISGMAYAASKAAVWSLIKQASTNMAPYGIRANALAPGLYLTELAQSVMTGRKPESEPYGHLWHIPAQRFGTDEDMAGSILYLASRAGAYCNGTAIVHDGGRLGQMPSTY